jgi:hypothetical protein
MNSQDGLVIKNYFYNHGIVVNLKNINKILKIKE